ncbi:ABC transporter ATP-binding protein [methanogenic archaeon mixed culture ISO4-G1]|nr:ABC transporter ATP-binding protein [methanogenic archaeon mixed culture ISO4-G1]
MESKVLELRNVSVVRGGKHILTSVDLDIFPNENVALIGPNGAGKTTIVRLLTGDVLPFYDEDDPAVMRIFGKDRWDIFDLRRRMGIVSMDLQNSFEPETTVSKVICSGFFCSLDVFRHTVVTEEMRAIALKSAEGMGISELMDRPIADLSLGEMRRALIARALVHNPELLVLDEPMTGLDIVMKSKFRQIFDILAKNGVSIVMITHDLSDIPSSVTRVIAVRDGRILADGSKSQILTDGTMSELYGESIKVVEDNGCYQMLLGGTAE